jgi:hypothetical protein
MTDREKEKIIYSIKVLKSNECPGCDSYKAPKKAFCWKCWNRLPSFMQKSLYSQIGCGFEEALDESILYLASM